MAQLCDITRFVTGAGQQGIFNTAFSLSFEIIGPALRLLVLSKSLKPSIPCLLLKKNHFHFYCFYFLTVFSSSWKCIFHFLRVPFLPWISLQTVMGLAPSLAFAVGLIVVSITVVIVTVVVIDYVKHHYP